MNQSDLKQVNKRKKPYSPHFYRKWYSINKRCNDTKCVSYGRYGAKGVKVEWPSFDEFFRDMHQSYKRHVAKHGEFDTTIDRIDNHGNYSKENCRWATQKVQQSNRSTNVLIEYNGKKKTITQWAEKLGMNPPTLWERIYKRGWTIEKAFTQAPKSQHYYGRFKK